MNSTEIKKVQDYLRQLFDNDNIGIVKPRTTTSSIEVMIGGEFIGTIFRDEDEGEVSYALNMSILAEDLEPVPEE
jgi:hypothetical protein